VNNTSRWRFVGPLIWLLGTVDIAPAADQAAGATAQQTPPHLEVERSLAAILEHKPQVLSSIATNDLEGLRAQLTQVRESLRQSRLQMDRALLVGAWSQKKEKRKAAQIIESMQEADILSLMGVAVVSGYDYPTHKVPVAVADSTEKLFALLGDLKTEVVTLNREL